MRSVLQLHEESERIARVLEGLETLAERPGHGDPVALGAVIATLDFLEAFADGCHHAKEEEGLFPVVEARGLCDAGLLAALRAEHAQARTLLRDLRDTTADEARAGTDLARTLKGYVTLQRVHYAKEDRLLREVAPLLSSADEHRVQAAFDAIEARLGGRGAYEALCAVGRALEAACRAEVGRTVPRAGDAVAAHVMRPNVPTLVPAESLTRAAHVMETLGVRELPVVEDGALVGILALRDILPHRGHYEWTAVRAAMTLCPVTVEPHTPVQAVADLLIRRGINAVPVAAGGALLGMVGRADLLRLLLTP